MASSIATAWILFYVLCALETHLKDVYVGDEKHFSGNCNLANLPTLICRVNKPLESFIIED